jgi:hypothetical protein
MDGYGRHDNLTVADQAAPRFTGCPWWTYGHDHVASPMTDALPRNALVLSDNPGPGDAGRPDAGPRPE